MADQLEEIKKKIDIVQYISEFVQLKKAGRNFKGLCPFHSEKTPSFIVSPERQIWHCFGSCGTGGDIFAFLMKTENIEFGEALRILAKRAGVKLVSYQPTEAEKQKQILYEINHLATEYFHYLLLNHPVGKRALNYILGRGISKASLEEFMIGYAPNMWEGLQKFLVNKKNYRKTDLEAAGLIIVSQRQRGSYYDRFRDRLIFPLKDHRDNICGFAGRLLDPKAKEAKYVNTPETAIYHKSDLLYGLTEAKDEIKKQDKVVLVEGELDMISSYQAGVKNTVAIKGSALTVRQVQLLARFTKNLILALDADNAGNEAAKRGIETADNVGLIIRVVEVTGGKDPDEVAQKDPKSWRQQVAGAIPVYDYFLDNALAHFDANTGEGKKKISQLLAPIWAKITDQIMQSHYAKLLAKKLGVEEEAVNREINRIKAPSEENRPAKIMETVSGPIKNRRELLEEHLLALGFQSGDWQSLRKRKVAGLVKTLRLVKILEALAQYLKKYKTFESSRLVKMLPPELTDGFNRLYLADIADIVSDEDKLENQKELSKKDQQDLAKLNCEFRDLTVRLTKLGDLE
jgi:DNA primase